MKKSTKLKIGLVLDDGIDSNDGVQQYVKSLGGWLVSEGHTVHYLVGQSISNKNNVHSLSKNISVRFNGNKLTIPLISNTSKIKELLDSQKYDVLHVQMPYSPLMAGKIIKFAPKTTAIVGTFHILPTGEIQSFANKALGAILRSQIKRFDAICSVSPAAAEFAKLNYNIASTVVPNLIDIKSWQSSVKNHPNRICFLGRLVPRKGCMQLLKAILELPPIVSDSLEVLIAGDGPERDKLQKFASDHGMTNINFLGYLDEATKRDYLASSQLAVFPSTGGESFGIVLIEAMAAGAGVVLGGNNPGYSSVLSKWPDVLVEPNDSKQFANKIQKLLEDKQLSAHIHNMQSRDVLQYDTKSVGSKVLELYSQALLHSRQEMR